MKAYLFLAGLALAGLSPASAATITTEDFQTGATGWTNNFTSDPGPNNGGFSRHLGRGGVGNTSSKTFVLSGNQSSVTVAFDWYRIDSWDGEFFRATVGDGVNSFTSSHQGVFNDGGPANIYSPNWTDRKQAISFDFATTAKSITLTFSSTLDQDASDESWGVDNLQITANGAVPGVPEPASWAMMIAGFGLAGAAARRRNLLVTA
jgi:hypothetical protein